MASSEVIFLKDEKIRELAHLIRGHEMNNLYYIKFQNLSEQLKYMTMVNDNEKSVTTILDNCKGLINRYKNDAVRGPIAGYILVYAEKLPQQRTSVHQKLHPSKELSRQNDRSPSPAFPCFRGLEHW